MVFIIRLSNGQRICLVEQKDSLKLSMWDVDPYGTIAVFKKEGISLSSIPDIVSGLEDSPELFLDPEHAEVEYGTEHGIGGGGHEEFLATNYGNGSTKPSKENFAIWTLHNDQSVHINVTQRGIEVMHEEYSESEKATKYKFTAQEIVDHICQDRFKHEELY